ncbi:MAG TPA: hypothetical protein VFE46_05670, partial [Pirellulales bacterium]|nr:hypothetical protein [Pirellulales bacterium]
MFRLGNSWRQGANRLRRQCRSALASPRKFELLESRRLLANSSLVYPDADGHLVYVADPQGNVIPNFSTVGYMTGDVPLPDTTGGVSVPVMATVNPGAAGVDMTTAIQNAINTVSAMSMQSNGFRGAVLLTAGNYPISGALTISASGVVLEGQGNNAAAGTRLEATGITQRVLITVAGSGSMSTVSGTTHNITNSYVPVGATSFTVDSTANLHVGDTVIVSRPSTQAWINAIGMETLTNPWTPGSKNLNSDRVITAINGSTITIDAPLTQALDQQYGGGTIFKYTWSGRISNVGIENLYTYSDFTGTTDTNTTHATGSIFMDKVQNAWAENITSDNFATNVITTGSGAKWITFDHMTVQNTSQAQSNIDDAPSGFGNSGQEILYENGVFTNAYHAISMGGSVPGPNVYTNITITDPLEGALGLSHSRDETGPHQRYATGGLFDDVSDTDWINIRNAGNEGSGHGWQGANFVLWNVNARTDVSSPPTAQNWIIGGSGSTSEGTGEYNARGSTVTPLSLYSAQLMDRLTPTVATPAAAAPGTVAGKTTTLSVLGADAAPESLLTYTWSTVSAPTGAPVVTFSANGTNASKSATATFGQAGTYTFQAAIQYPGGFSATSNVSVTVNQTLTAMSVLQSNLSINENTPQQFVTAATDQFGNPMAASVIWSATGGSISTGGLYTSGTTPGSYQITATSGSVIGSTGITVTSAAAVISAAAAASPTQISATTTALSVLALGDSGQTDFTYTWSVSSLPGGAPMPIFSANGTNAAKNTTATFSQAGLYTFLVTASNAGASNATSSVSVVVNQTLTKITVAPATAGLNEHGTRQFSASATDQFNRPDSVNLTWTSGGGAITSGGFFTAGTTPGNFVTTATNGSVSGTANVTVSNAVPTIAVAASSAASPVLNASTNLNVLGNDDAGETNLIYTWTVSAKPTGAVAPTFALNGTHAAKGNAATFFAPGSYTFLVTVTDAGGLSATSSVTVSVQSSIHSITVTPTTASVGTTKSQQFMGTAFDQFGVALTTQPTFTWAIAGGGAGGTVSTAGLYTAPANTGADSITATSGLYVGTATVNVIPSSLGIFTSATDVGAPTPAGSSNFNTTSGVYTVAGGGNDISGTSDQFQYLYKTVTGDASITAEV